jgi:hypothetical protein
MSEPIVENCHYHRQPDGSWLCVFCKDLAPPSDEAPPDRACPRLNNRGRRRPTLPYCLFKGREKRRQEGPAGCCGGRRPQFKVFFCAVHGECQLAFAVPGVKVCRCDDYRAADQGGDAGAAENAKLPRAR